MQEGTMGSKNEKIMGLFLGIALTLTSGCSSNNGHTHIDQNKDGYCDIDGQRMPNSSNSSSSSHSNYSNARGGSTSSASTSDNISSGSAPKGGIGGHSSGGGG
jgi:hypothetical protein